MVKSKERDKPPKCHLGHPTTGHPYCMACGILVGSGHLEVETVNFRGKDLCPGCVVGWKIRERVAKREVTYDEFISFTRD